MDESRFTRILAGLMANAGRGQQLSAPLRSLHRQILRHFADTGEAPVPGVFAEWAAGAGVDSREALAGLVKADLAEADPDTGHILGAYPFTTAPCGHQVAIADGPAVQAYCAIDALAIPVMLGRDAAITARDPYSGTEIRVQVRSGQAAWAPSGVVVTLPASELTGIPGDGVQQPAADAACPTVSFFASAANAVAYQQAHGLALEILTVPQALRFGSAAFPLLPADGQPAPGAQARQGGLSR